MTKSLTIALAPIHPLVAFVPCNAERLLVVRLQTPRPTSEDQTLALLS